MGRKAAIFGHWLRGGRKYVTIGELLAQSRYGRRTEEIARGIILEEREAGPHIKLKLKGAKRPLYVPADIPRHQLHQVVAELFVPENWHYYEAFGTRVAEDDIVVDCGAAEGLFSLLVSPRCRKCYAVEPLPDFVASLKRTFKGAKSVEIIPCALGSRPGEAVIVGKGLGAALKEDGEGPRVNVATIDELFFDRKRKVTYIKADLEGYDLDMLKGARKTIKKFRPKIAITTYHAKDHAGKMEELLKGIEPRYTIRCKGLEHRWGAPMMLHAWVE